MKRFVVILMLAAGMCFPAAGYDLGRAIEHADVVIWPVLDVDAAPMTAGYITLDEGMAAGTVVVAELSGQPQTPVAQQNQVQTRPAVQEQTQAVQQSVQMTESGPSVNLLQVENNSERSLFLMAGEIIAGGQQNRVVAQDTLIRPHSATMQLKVFCVEQGRWHSQRPGPAAAYFASATNLVSQSSLRKTVVQEAEQSMVWAKVSELNASQAAVSDTSDYSVNMLDPDRMKKVAQLVEAVMQQIPEHAVGVIVARAEGIQGGDVFATSELFAVLRQKILTSYLFEAVLDQAAAITQESPGLQRLDALDLLQTMVSARGEEPPLKQGEHANVTVRAGGLSGSYLLVVSGERRLRLHQVFFVEQ